MTWPLSVVVPWPPSGNHSHVQFKMGTRIMRAPSKETKAYWKAVETIVSEASTSRWEGGLLVVEATYFKPDNRRRDTDNARKTLADGVARGLGTDDTWFLWRDVDIQVDRKDPRVELTMYPRDGGVDQ